MVRTYLIGCSGFQYNDWQEVLYPRTLAKHLWLKYYSDQFNSVEINNTFYNFPKASILEKWRDATRADFKFTIKAPRLFTFEQGIVSAPDKLAELFNILTALENKLAYVLFQFPVTVEYDPPLLLALCEALLPYPNTVLEFRHASWWQPEVLAALTAARIIMCSVQAPRLPSVLHPSPLGFYLRLHGPNRWYRGHYSEDFLSNISQQIHAQAYPTGAIYFNNTMQGDAIADARFLIKALALPLPA